MNETTPGQALPDHADTSAELTAWLAKEEQRLLDVARGSRAESGFGYLGDAGEVVPGEGLRLLVTARMTTVFARAALRGDRSARAAAAHGVEALLHTFWDDSFGGWLSRVLPAEHDVVQAAIAATVHKDAHDHASVLLAAATADAAGIDGADALLERAATVLISRFWDEDQGALVDSFTRDWSIVEDYRGARANMRFVEAALAVYSVTGDAVWLRRAERVAERMMATAADNGHRIVEHFDAQWRPLPEYGRDSPADRFRPYGYSVGHSMEWARLLVELARALRGVMVDAEWMVDTAACLFGVAIDNGWQTGDRPGFVSTLDWDDVPVIGQRMHVVLAEAIGASWALFEELEHEVYLQRYAGFWRYARRNFVDRENGSWIHELGYDLLPSSRVWLGRPDILHAYTAVLTPMTPRLAAARARAAL
ncbi:AGE family epimerase/isomerase [Microbacteriaceae bacterium VKM Ac-2855]|nr:AGE family epimerase/isomerase [Microbacteriaceae bacterium VKM Ac-2855]